MLPSVAAMSSTPEASPVPRLAGCSPAELRAFLLRRGIDAARTNLCCASREPAFAELAAAAPNAEAFVDRMVFLPLHSNLDESDMDYLASAVASFSDGPASRDPRQEGPIDRRLRRSWRDRRSACAPLGEGREGGCPPRSVLGAAHLRAARPSQIARCARSGRGAAWAQMTLSKPSQIGQGAAMGKRERNAREDRAERALFELEQAKRAASASPGARRQGALPFQYEAEPDGDEVTAWSGLPLIERAFAVLPASVTERLFRADSACYDEKVLSCA